MTDSLNQSEAEPVSQQYGIDCSDRSHFFQLLQSKESLAFFALIAFNLLVTWLLVGIFWESYTERNYDWPCAFALGLSQKCLLLLCLVATWGISLGWGLGKVPIWIEAKWCILVAIVTFASWSLLPLFAIKLSAVQYTFFYVNGVSIACHTALAAMLTCLWQWGILSRRPLWKRMAVCFVLGNTMLGLLRSFGEFPASPESSFIWNQLCMTIGISLVLRIFCGYQLIDVAEAAPPAERSFKFSVRDLFIILTAVAVAISIVQFVGVVQVPNSFRIRFFLLAVLPAVAGTAAFQIPLSISWTKNIVFGLAIAGLLGIAPYIVHIVFLNFPISPGYAYWVDISRFHYWIREFAFLFALFTTIYCLTPAMMLRASGLHLIRQTPAPPSDKLK